MPGAISDWGIMNRYKVVVIGDEPPHGNPHPMPYLKGLREVNAEPNLSVASKTLAPA